MDRGRGEAFFQKDLVARAYRRRRDGCAAIFLKAGVRHATDMPQLKHHVAARIMDDLCHAFPGLNRGVGVNARRERVARPCWEMLVASLIIRPVEAR